ncbi:hypothetical protein TNCV_2347591 [Trichonephila clavipes]|nr:hypothetical protein TNCV_2347591 [Trichonephila clavipes]
MVNIDQVRIYHQRKRDERMTEVGNLDSSGSEYQASSFEDRPRSVLGLVSMVNDGVSKRKRQTLLGIKAVRRHFSNRRQARITCVQETKLPRKLVPDHQEERCKPKGDQPSLEENDSRSPARTTRIEETGSSPNTRVIKSLSRSRRMDDPAVKVHDEVETTDSKSARRRTESQRVGGPHRSKSSLEMSTTEEIISQVVLFHYFFTDSSQVDFYKKQV